MINKKKTNKQVGKNRKTKKVQRGGAIKTPKIPDLPPPRVGSKTLNTHRTNFRLKNTSMQSLHNSTYHLTQPKTLRNKVKSFFGIKPKQTQTIYESYKAQQKPELYSQTSFSVGANTYTIPSTVKNTSKYIEQQKIL